MNLPIPWALFGRVFAAIRENPCAIEEIDGRDGGQWIRVRNDSKTVVQIFGVSFRWRLKGRKEFDEFWTPLVWVLSFKHGGKILEPGHSFEHPINVNEIGKPVAACIISVEHNRQPKPEEKRFAVK